jgi:hypothetical protein
LSEGEVAAAELALPVSIGIDLVDEDGPVLAAVSGEISLCVAVDVEPPDHAPALNRFFPDACVDRLSAPRNIARETHIYRKEARH